MKSLELNEKAFAGATLLSRAEMKKVMGGLEDLGTSGDCENECYNNSDCTNGTTCVPYDFGSSCPGRTIYKCTNNHA
ncbi:hypothetical protein [Pedobacter sp. UBA4863]|uniref:hypothetical protein n=1 Tax=Pedobacter sp. UBA4863 TaxID=1947060 RepID=UPI0025FA5473|nr:hypothetical protein [Pedobacter sp. UBA4863]